MMGPIYITSYKGVGGGQEQSKKSSSLGLDNWTLHNLFDSQTEYM